MENSLLFFGGTYEVRQDLAAAATTTKAYYAIGGQMIAVRTVSAADSTLHYILTDHLGSTSAILDETGTLTNQQRFLPFGQPRADVPTPFAAPTDFGFTGQRLLDPGLGGLMDYRARFYSPYLSRFIQPDTLIPVAGDPQAWNRYSYVLNSPVKYNDSSGHKPCWATNKYSCNLTPDDIRKLLTSPNKHDQEFLKNLYGQNAPIFSTVYFDVTLTASQVEDLVSEIDAVMKNDDWVSYISGLAKLLGAFEITTGNVLPGGISVSMGLTYDNTIDDLQVLRLELIKRSDNFRNGLRLTTGQNFTNWGIAIDEQIVINHTTYSRIPISPIVNLFEYRSYFNASHIWLLGWYYFDLMAPPVCKRLHKC